MNISFLIVYPSCRASANDFPDIGNFGGAHRSERGYPRETFDINEKARDDSEFLE